MLDNLADVDFYGGQRGTEHPSFEYGGSKGNFSYFTTGQYSHTDRGVEPPTSGPTAIHDTANQGIRIRLFFVFAESDDAAEPDHRRLRSIISRFRANPESAAGLPAGRRAGLSVGRCPRRPVRAELLRRPRAAGHRRRGYRLPDRAVQPLFDGSFYPDYKGDLIYNGAASKVFRSDWGNGFQLDTAYHGVPDHTIRLGGYFDSERAEIDNHEATFPAAGGVQSSRNRHFVVDNIALQTWIYSVYLQDEWKPFDQLTINYGVALRPLRRPGACGPGEPRVALEYTPIKGTTFHAAYARQFTPPPTELVSVSTYQEIQRHYRRAGFQWQWNSDGGARSSVRRGRNPAITPGLNVGIDSYYKKATDLIDEGQFGPALIFETFNYAKGRVWGTEFTGSYTHENSVHLRQLRLQRRAGHAGRVGAVQLRARRTEVHQQPLYLSGSRPDVHLSAGAVYNWNGFTFSIDGIYGSGLRSGFANTGNLPYYIQVDAGITRRVPLPNNRGVLEFRTAIVNLADHTLPGSQRHRYRRVRRSVRPSPRVIRRDQVGASIHKTRQCAGTMKRNFGGRGGPCTQC